MLACFQKLRVGDILYIAMYDCRLRYGFIDATRNKGIAESDSTGIYQIIDFFEGHPVVISSNLQDREVVSISCGRPVIKWRINPTIVIDEYLIRGIKKATPATV
jgi:hypothetical protein